jgi:pyridoxine 4-dehydrogenase
MQAINWAICKGTIPIPGSRNLKQAEEALGALGWRLSAGEVAELEAAADKCPTIIQNIFATK